MIHTNFRVIEYGSPEWETSVRLREEILRIPLGSTFSAEELAEEKNHIHIAGFIDDAIIATVALVPEEDCMKMQRVVVAVNLRNQNIGTEMMKFCEQYILGTSIKRIYCHARNTAVNFYRNNGYTQIGDYFDEDGIPHLMMQKEL
ncbi:MAG: GNAT family N-acetyltransferase [Candidatus Kapaibacterium sp.]|nr:GNAT family N-acetyltransferase [Bacteroidota bacterium]